MKNFNHLLPILFVTLVVSCNSNSSCLNEGENVGGTCVCTDYFEGEDCGTPIANRYFGTYSVVDEGYFHWTAPQFESCYQTFDINRSHTSVISADPSNPSSMKISNYFGDAGNELGAWVDLDNPNRITTQFADIAYENCPDGYMAGSSQHGRPTGTLSEDGNTLVITYHYAQWFPNGWNNVWQENYYTSTFTRQQ